MQKQKIAPTTTTTTKLKEPINPLQSEKLMVEAVEDIYNLFD